MSANEELQSTNEELQTSKEELQSLNEELNTINAQLESKLDELERTNNDLDNLLTSTNVATIFLDPQAPHPTIHARGDPALQPDPLRRGSAARRHRAAVHRSGAATRRGDRARAALPREQGGANARRTVVHPRGPPLPDAGQPHRGRRHHLLGCGGGRAPRGALPYRRRSWTWSGRRCSSWTAPCACSRPTGPSTRCSGRRRSETVNRLLYELGEHELDVPALRRGARRRRRAQGALRRPRADQRRSPTSAGARWCSARVPSRPAGKRRPT